MCCRVCRTITTATPSASIGYDTSANMPTSNGRLTACVGNADTRWAIMKYAVTVARVLLVEFHCHLPNVFVRPECRASTQGSLGIIAQTKIEMACKWVPPWNVVALTQLCQREVGIVRKRKDRVAMLTLLPPLTQMCNVTMKQLQSFCMFAVRSLSSEQPPLVVSWACCRSHTCFEASPLHSPTTMFSNCCILHEVCALCCLP